MANYTSIYTGAEIDERLKAAGTALVDAKKYTDLEIGKLRREMQGGATSDTVSFLETATKTTGFYARKSSSSSALRFTESEVWNCYRGAVTEGEIYHVSTYSTYDAFAVAFLDTNGAIVSTIPQEKLSVGQLVEIDVVVPSGVAEMIINEEATKIVATVTKFEKTATNTAIDFLNGKKIACVGDSITEASNPNGGFFKNYAELVAERHGMTVYKDGKGGSTMTNVSTQRPFCVDRYLNVPADFDILTIWFGWNDASYADIGTIESTEDTTFYGAYKKVLEYFITTYPTKKIGLIVPYGNASVEPYRVAVRELSAMYGVPCLDLADGKKCSLLWGEANEAQLARRAALTYDGTHPNQVGHEYLSTMYEAFIKSL